MGSHSVRHRHPVHRAETNTAMVKCSKAAELNRPGKLLHLYASMGATERRKGTFEITLKACGSPVAFRFCRGAGVPGRFENAFIAADAFI